MAVISKKAPNRTTENQPPDWWNKPPSWYQPGNAAGNQGSSIAPASTGAWGANWGSPPPAMQTPGAPAAPGAAGGGLVSQINGMYGIDLNARYTAGNVIRIKDGNFYRVVGAQDQIGKKDSKGLVKVRGRDGKLYYMKKLSSKEAKNIGQAPTPAPAKGGQAGTPAANRGFQPAGDWWTQDWWDRPGFYKRMY